MNSRRQDANTLEQQNDAQLDELHGKLRALHAVGSYSSLLLLPTSQLIHTMYPDRSRSTYITTLEVRTVF